MKRGDTVYVIDRTVVVKGIKGVPNSAQGFYTRWTDGFVIHFGDRVRPFSRENIFSTEETAKKELFMRNLRWPRLRGAA